MCRRYLHPRPVAVAKFLRRSAAKPTLCPLFTGLVWNGSVLAG
jgi:hypothetical protein